MNKKSNQQQEEEHNIFRDSLLRYLGYANEIGESFRYQFPRAVMPSYILAFGYCGMDSLSTGYREWNKAKESEKLRNSSIATFDTLLWQTLASVMIPGFTINAIVRVSRFAVLKTAANQSLKTWLPTGFGLGSIPFIIHPIDNSVDYLLDNTTRRWTHQK